MTVIRDQLLLLGMSLITGSFAAVPDVAAQEIPKWLQDREAAWVKAYNAGDGGALAKIWVADGVLLLQGDVIQGRAAIEQRARTKNSCSFPINGAHVLNQLAVVWGESHCPGAAGTGPVKGKWMRVYERQADHSWLIVRDTGQRTTSSSDKGM